MSTVPSPPRSSSSSRQTSPRRTRVCRPHKSSSSVSSVHSFHLPSRITVSASSSSNSIRSTHTPSSSTSSAFFNSPTETSPDQTRTRTSSNGSEPHVLLPSVFVEGGMNEEGVMYPPSSYVQAEYAFEPAESGSYLSFERGEIIRIVNRDASGWWDGEVDGRRGWFPSNYINPAGFANILPPAARQNSMQSETSQSSNSSSQSSAQSYGSSSLASSSGYPSRYDLESAPVSPSEAVGSAFAFLSQTSSPAPTSTSLQRMPSERRAMRTPARTTENRGHWRKISRIVRLMLDPISRGITLLENAIAGNRSSHFRPSTACIVSSVRDILEATGCLPRDTPTLLQYPSLDNERKRVLCRLNDLSKRAQLAGADNVADDFREVEGRKMLQSAYKLRERLETFLETAVECGVELPGGRVRVEANDEDSGGRHARELEHTPTPASLRRFGTDVSSSTNRRLQNVFKQRDSAKLAIISDGLDERIADARNSPTSSVGSSSSLGTSPSSPSTPSSLLIDEHGRVDVIPSVRDSHERLLSILAAFIGHIHSHSSNSHPSSHAHILDVIRACIDKVRDLLSVLEAVAMHKEIIEAKPQEVKRLESLGTALYQATADLVTSAEIVAALPFTDEPSEQNEDEQAGLLSGATRTLRSAQDCVQAVIQCVSRGPGQHPFVVFLSSPGSPGSAFSHATPRSLHSIGRSLSSLSPLTMKSPVLYDDEAIEELASGDDELEDAPLGGDDEDLTVRAPEMFSRITIEEEPSRPSLDSASSSTIAGGSNRDVEEGPEVGLMSTSSSNRPLLLAERTLSTSTEASLALSTNSTTTDSSFRSSFDSSSNSLFTSAIKVASSSDIPSHFDYLNVNESAANVISHSIQKDLHRPQLRPRADSNPLTRLSISVTESSSPERSHTSLGGAVDRPVVHPRTMTLAESRVWLVGCSYHPSEIAYNSDGVIIGATLPVLVEKMTPHDAMVDPTFSATFFLTFRLFSTPLDILEEVIRRFDLQPPSGLALGPQEFALWQEHKVTPIQLRIFAFLRSWLDHNFLSSVDYVVIPHLIHFATQGSIRHALPSLADKLLDSIEKHVRQASLQPTPEKTIKKISSIERLRNVAVPPTPIMDKKLFNNLKNPASSVSITDFDATELARQLSIMESKLYCAIEPHELLACGKKSVRSIKAMSTFSNQITGFVSETILNEQDTKKRTALLKYFIKLATRLVGLQNFSGGVAVLAALNGSSVARLKKTWEGLSTKSKNSFQSLRQLFDVSRNHATYRARLRDTAPPALPFLGNILTDLTFLNDGNLATRPSPLNPENTQLINLSKYNAISRVVGEFRKFQVPFSLCEVPTIQSHLDKVLAEKGSGSLEGLYRKSLRLEPKIDSSMTPKL